MASAYLSGLFLSFFSTMFTSCFGYSKFLFCLSSFKVREINGSVNKLEFLFCAGY